MADRLSLSFQIEGERVLLRAPRSDDAAALEKIRTASWDFLRPWLPAQSPDAEPVATVEGRIKSDRAVWLDERGLRFVLCDRVSGEIIGRVSLNNIVRGVGQFADLGYWIGSSWARRGLTTEAVQLALDVAFGRLGLHRVQAGIIPRNAPSLALARRVGFREEGLALRFVKIAGVWEDHVILALTAEEWPALRSRVRESKRPVA